MAVLKAILTSLARRLGAPWALGWLLLAVLGASAGAAAPADKPPSAEYQIKAAFLFNFAQFVEWPARAFRDAQGPIVIGILGEDPFGSYLDDLVRNESVGGRPLAVRRFNRPEDITDCHILFVSRAMADQFEKLAAELQRRNLLSVGDTDNFNRLGGIVRFVTENGKIRLRINMEAAKAADLILSSKLLRWATIVTPGKN